MLYNFSMFKKVIIIEKKKKKSKRGEKALSRISSGKVGAKKPRRNFALWSES